MRRPRQEVFGRLAEANGERWPGEQGGGARGPIEGAGARRRRPARPPSNSNRATARGAGMCIADNFIEKLIPTLFEREKTAACHNGERLLHHVPASREKCPDA